MNLENILIARNVFYKERFGGLSMNLENILICRNVKFGERKGLIVIRFYGLAI